MKRTVDAITLPQLQAQFHLPIAKAAKHFGICESNLKRLCRRYGIVRWPQRRIRTLKGRIAVLKEMKVKSYTHISVEGELDHLQQELAQLYQGQMEVQCQSRSTFVPPLRMIYAKHWISTSPQSILHPLTSNNEIQF